MKTRKFIPDKDVHVSWSNENEYSIAHPENTDLTKLVAQFMSNMKTNKLICLDITHLYDRWVICCCANQKLRVGS